MKKHFKALAILVVLGLAASATAAGWTTFPSDEFGFHMLVPPGVKADAHDYGGGWGGVYFKAGGHTEVWGAAKLGKAASKDVALHQHLQGLIARDTCGLRRGRRGATGK